MGYIPRGYASRRGGPGPDIVREESPKARQKARKRPSRAEILHAPRQFKAGRAVIGGVYSQKLTVLAQQAGRAGSCAS